LEVARSLSLRSETILDEHTEPLLSATGQIGFVTSTTGGSLISFNTATGKVLSSVVVGEGAGRCTMVEKGHSRLIAVPCANAPDRNRPATISIIDASNPRRLDPVSLIVLPTDAHLVSSARALLTADERYVVIPSYFDVPALFSFDARTGQMISELQLIGRPSSVTMFERTVAIGGGLIAVTSPVTNTVSIINIDEQGRLGQQSSFSQAVEGLDEDNNAAFSLDGLVVYVASSKTQQLLAIDAAAGRLASSIHVEPSPTRVTVARGPDGGDLIAVTRVPARRLGVPGGVAIVAATAGHLSLQTEFTPPDPIQFSTSNNAGFTSDGWSAFVGSRSGVLFAFSTTTGELQSSQMLGSELMGLSVSDPDRMIATVRRTAKSDQIVILNFDTGDPADAKSAEKSAEKASAKKSPVPVINSLHPDRVEQGQVSKLHVTIRGSNFPSGASLLINGTTTIGAQMINPKVLIGKLPPELMAEPGTISVQVQAPDGTQSQPAALTVTTVQGPQISDLSPSQVPGPHPPFELRVNGSNFKETSVIVVSGQSLNTTLVRATQLRAEIPHPLSKQVAQLSVQVVDAASPTLVSNTVTLNLFGPVISQIVPSRSPVIAGTGRFTMLIRGENFRDDARVRIADTRLDSSQVKVVSRNLIKTSIPASFIDNSGTLPVIVVNPDGSASNAVNLDSLGPAIQSLDPGQIIAGPTDSKVAISGANFRFHLGVKVGRSGDQRRRVPVHFISDSKIIVVLDSALVSQPGSLTFQVINPGKNGGVPSATKDIQLVGPSITDAQLTAGSGKNPDVILTITGSSFAAGARVQFLKEDQIELEREPDRVKVDKIILAIRASKLVGLGDYNVRVVNPGKIPSNQFQPHN
jgi:outer membrane protein assembly factor BamB